MATSVLRVEIEGIASLHFNVSVTMLKDGTERIREFSVRDDGWKIWLYQENNGSQRLVEYVSFGTDSDRRPDKLTALAAVEEWAHDHYDD